MTKKLTISSENISAKQWSILLIELNMIKDSWKPFAKLDIQTPGFDKIVKWRKKRHDEKDE